MQDAGNGYYTCSSDSISQKTLWGETGWRAHCIQEALPSSQNSLFRTPSIQASHFETDLIYDAILQSLYVKALPIFHQRIKSIWKKNAKLI